MKTHYNYYHSEDPEDFEDIQTYICGSKAPEEPKETNRWKWVNCKK